MIALVVGNGSAAAAAMCHHQSAREHAAARESHDKRIAAAALTEETADLAGSKKGALSDAAGSLPPYTLPSSTQAQPLRVVEPLPVRVKHDPGAGWSVGTSPAGTAGRLNLGMPLRHVLVTAPSEH